MKGSTDQSSRAALFGKVRSAVLGLLFCNHDRSFYFRELERKIVTGRGALQRELRNLFQLGLITRRKLGNLIQYQANPDSPLFNEIKSLMVKTAGLKDILADAVIPLEDRIEVAFIYGSFAKRTETSNSDVDIMVLCELGFSEILDAFANAQELIGREINPSIFRPEEFVMKLSQGNHFLNSIVVEPKIYLIGDDGVFSGLAKKRMVS